MRIFNPEITLEQAKQRVRNEGFAVGRSQEHRGMVCVESCEQFDSGEPRIVVMGYTPDTSTTVGNPGAMRYLRPFDD